MPKECDFCGEKLTPEEIEYPAHNGQGEEIEGICDECFHEHYEFTCSRCENYEYEEFQHIWLVVFEETPSYPEPIKPGIYEIVKFPYFCSPMIGQSTLYADAIRATRAKIDFGGGYYPCGHICQRCAKNLRLRRSKAGKALHEVT